MHQGIDLAKENSVITLERAVRCFDEAIALRSTLPLEENHFYRYGLSAGWINRGDALAQLEGSRSLEDAIKSYDEALLLLETLPLEENPLYPRRLAITWINRGIALQKRETADDKRETTECFREAIAVLERFSAVSIADSHSLLAGAWTNLAGVLAGAGEAEAEDARSSANKALALVRYSEQTDIVAAEMGLKARHALCRLAVREMVSKKALSKTAIAEATDSVDEALALARHWHFFQKRNDLVELTREIFRFGCRIYENGQPHFLAEFLMEGLAPETFGGAIPPNQEIFDAVQAAIWSVVAKLQLDGFQFVATSAFEPFLSDLQELRLVEERLEQIRPTKTN